MLKLTSVALLTFSLLLLLSAFLENIIAFDVWKYLLTILAICLVIITYAGIHFLNTSKQRIQIKALQSKKETSDIRHNQTSIAAKDRFAKVNLPSQKAQDKMQLLDALMLSEQLYVDSGLNRTKEIGRASCRERV